LRVKEIETVRATDLTVRLRTTNLTIRAIHLVLRSINMVKWQILGTLGDGREAKRLFVLAAKGRGGGD
jgi:hypothetical protein